MATTKTPRKKEKQTKRLDLKVGMKDFGPIAEGEIELKPLTVFIGANNSGKSYAAILIKSILEAYNIPFNSSQWRHSFSKKNDINAIFDNSLELLELQEEINLSEEFNAIEIPKEIIEKINLLVLKEIFEEVLERNITRMYACQLNELSRIGMNSFELNVSSEVYDVHLMLQANNLKISKSKQANLDITITMEPTKAFDIDTGEANEEIVVLVHTQKSMQVGTTIEKWENLSQSDLVEFVVYACLSENYELLNISCQYLPAARSGIIQGHKALVASVIKQSPFFGIETQREIPKFSGVVADFLSSIIEFSSNKKGSLYEFAEELERELIKGNVILTSDDKNLYPEIKYRFQGVEIPLHRTSSTVSELTPLILYLKYIVQPGSVLIIEEPEAHLHPANIRILAKYLVRLVRKGVNVLITTHSEYLLEQLNNFYLFSKVDPDELVSRYNRDKDDYLNHDELGVYEFHYDEIANGYKIKKAEVTQEDGISQEEFVKVFESLFDETSKLRNDLDDYEE